MDPIDSQKAEDILPKILPPQIFEKDGQKWLQKVSSTPATRLDVQRLAQVKLKNYFIVTFKWRGYISRSRKEFRL